MIKKISMDHAILPRLAKDASGKRLRDFTGNLHPPGRLRKNWITGYDF